MIAEFVPVRLGIFLRQVTVPDDEVVVPPLAIFGTRRPGSERSDYPEFRLAASAGLRGGKYVRERWLLDFEINFEKANSPLTRWPFNCERHVHPPGTIEY